MNAQPVTIWSPTAIANAIHFDNGIATGFGRWERTLEAIKDGIEAGDQFFEELTAEGFRLWSDAGWSCIVRARSGWRIA